MAVKKVKKKKEFDLKSFIIRELRRAFRRSPLYSGTKNRFKHEYFEPSKTGKPMRRVHYKCAKCGLFFLDKAGQRDIAVDHVLPIISVDTGWVDYDSFVKGLFCGEDNLQILCNYAGERNGVKSCHKIKTEEERAILAKTKKVLKEKKNGIVL